MNKKFKKQTNKIKNKTLILTTVSNHTIVYMKPTPAMYCLHIRQEQFVGLHLLIEDLKASKEVISFSSVGRRRRRRRKV